MSDSNRRWEREQVRNLELPARIVERVEKRVPRSDFDSAAGYVTFVLEEVLERVEADDSRPAHETVDEGKIQERLQSLGYLDQ